MATEVRGTDPIVNEHRVNRFTFGSARPIPGPNNVLIWKAANGTVYPLNSPPTFGEGLVGAFQVYEVDMRQHPTQIEYDLPSSDSAMTFKAVLRATWQVKRPDEVVRNLVRNAESVHDTWLQDLLRSAGSKYSILDKEVEQKINGQLGNQVGREKFGIAIIDLKIEISLDAPTKAHVDEMLRRKRQQEIDVLAAGNQQTLEQMDGQWRKQREDAESQHRARLAQAQAELDIKLRQQQLAAERLIRAQEEGLELALKRDRMDFYTKAFESGNGALLVLRLVEHPEEVDTVLNFLQKERELAFDNGHIMLRALMDAQVIDPTRLDPVQRAAVDAMLNGVRPLAHGVGLPSEPTETPAAIADFAPVMGGIATAEPAKATEAPPTAAISPEPSGMPQSPPVPSQPTPQDDLHDYE
jgi:regulator of protease activity HflC (stomatin/prohibitin superfamily)